MAVHHGHVDTIVDASTLVGASVGDFALTLGETNMNDTTYAAFRAFIEALFQERGVMPLDEAIRLIEERMRDSAFVAERFPPQE